MIERALAPSKARGRGQESEPIRSLSTRLRTPRSPHLAIERLSIHPESMRILLGWPLFEVKKTRLAALNEALEKSVGSSGVRGASAIPVNCQYYRVSDLPGNEIERLLGLPHDLELLFPVRGRNGEPICLLKQDPLQDHQTVINGRMPAPRWWIERGRTEKLMSSLAMIPHSPGPEFPWARISSPLPKRSD